MACRRPTRQLMRVRWDRLRKAHQECRHWEAFALWVRAIVEAEGRAPSWLAEILKERCPGFVKSEALLNEPSLLSNQSSAQGGRGTVFCTRWHCSSSNALSCKLRKNAQNAQSLHLGCGKYELSARGGGIGHGATEARREISCAAGGPHDWVARVFRRLRLPPRRGVVMPSPPAFWRARNLLLPLAGTRDSSACANAPPLSERGFGVLGGGIFEWGMK